MSVPQHDPFDLCGTTISAKYRVISVVGEGGFGVVYRGEHEGFDIPIAIKCLKVPTHLDLEAQEDLVRRLREEGRLLVRLSQRTSGIVQALDAGTFTNKRGIQIPYLILEWLEGRTLAADLRERRAAGKPNRSLRETFELLSPVMQALAVAHDEKIAHRDIKPDNLFLVESRGKTTTKILDFGIAKVFDDVPSVVEAMTGRGPSVFTPSYGAPEQFQKRLGASGPWTDVFAMALVIVEVLTGRRALEGDEVVDLFQVAAHPGVRPTPRERGVKVSDAVERVFETALCPDPRKRFPNAEAFWKAFEVAIVTDDAAETLQSIPGAFKNTSDVPTAEFLQGSGIEATAPTEQAVLKPEETAPTVQGTLAPETLLSPGQNESREPPTRPESVKTVDPRPDAAPKTSHRAIAAVVGLLVLGGIVVGTRPWKDPVSTPTPAISSSKASSPEAMATKTVPEAWGLYQQAQQEFHDGREMEARKLLGQALDLDRNFAAAYLLLALMNIESNSPEMRENYLAARRLANSLDEHDTALVDAMEALARQPPNFAEWDRRIEALSDKFPRDVMLLNTRARSRQQQLQFDQAIEICNKALQIDPTFVRGWITKGESQSMKGDLEGELASYQACLDGAPVAGTLCLSVRTTAHSRAGRCKEMMADAKRLLTLDPSRGSSHTKVATALFAIGAPHEAIVEAASHSWELVPPSEKLRAEYSSHATLAIAEGQFDEAVRYVELWEAQIAKMPDQNSHGETARELVRIYYEMGDARKAAEIADQFLRRMNAWTEPRAGDWTITFRPYQWRGGSVSREDFDRSRTEWLANIGTRLKVIGLSAGAEWEWLNWTHAYAGVAMATEDEAKAAIAAMPAERTRAIEQGRFLEIDLAMGQAYVLAKQFERAQHHLERVAHSCVTLVDPFVTTIAALYLGMALEGRGDVAGAKAAYGIVLGRWGQAKPKSMTAETARKRLAALK